MIARNDDETKVPVSGGDEELMFLLGSVDEFLPALSDTLCDRLEVSTARVVSCNGLEEVRGSRGALYRLGVRVVQNGLEFVVVCLHRFSLRQACWNHRCLVEDHLTLPNPLQHLRPTI